MPSGVTVELDWSDWGTGGVGPYSCVRANNINETNNKYEVDLRFILHNGQEFNGNQQQAQLHFYTKTNPGSNFISGHIQYVNLYDAAGRSAHTTITTQIDVWEHFDLNLGIGSIGWTVDAGFDWNYIKEIAFHRVGFLKDYFKVDEVYFSYYKLIPPILHINSEPSGYQFVFDSVGPKKTPYYFNPTPNMPVTIRMDPTNFLNWEVGATDPTNPVRTETLAEGEDKTITAYYSTPPPPSPNNVVILVAAGIGITIVAAYLLYTRKW